LIVRPTSEDVITGHLFQGLKILNPCGWLPDLLNQALGVRSFRRQVFRQLTIDLWRNRPKFPRDLVPWNEGSTQVDATITWENPPTTIIVEMKYGSGLSETTARNVGQHDFAADQLTRNIRVGLLECGYYEQCRLFPTGRRDLVVLVIGPEKGNPLISDYRDPTLLRRAIPNSDLIPTLPKLPFVGELNYRDIVAILRAQRRWCNRAERVMTDLLTDYLEMKLTRVPRRSTPTECQSFFDQCQESDAGK